MPWKSWRHKLLGWILVKESGIQTAVQPLDERVFVKLEAIEVSSIKTIGGESLSIKGKGTVSAKGIQFGEVLYVPSLTKNLLSTGSMADDGYI